MFGTASGRLQAAKPGTRKSKTRTETHTQGAQYSLIQEFTLNHIWDPEYDLRKGYRALWVVVIPKPSDSQPSDSESTD